MTIKIKEIYGYTLVYDEKRKTFSIQDIDGTELAYGQTQDEAEAKAKALSKQDFKRIPIVRVEQEGQVTPGELTSLNRDDRAAWISMEKGEDSYGSGRRKISLRYDHSYYEATEANLKVIEGIKTKREALKLIKAEIEVLIDTLEKPIDGDFFGITGW